MSCFREIGAFPTDPSRTSGKSDPGPDGKVESCVLRGRLRIVVLSNPREGYRINCMHRRWNGVPFFGIVAIQGRHVTLGPRGNMPDLYSAIPPGIFFLQGPSPSPIDDVFTLNDLSRNDKPPGSGPRSPTNYGKKIQIRHGLRFEVNARGRGGGKKRFACKFDREKTVPS